MVCKEKVRVATATVGGSFVISNEWGYLGHTIGKNVRMEEIPRQLSEAAEQKSPGFARAE